MNNDLVSIVIPVYNASKFLDETINSIFNQSYNNLEIIFINDCSKDNSTDIIKKYQKKDKRIILIDNKRNLGAAESRNVGIKKSTGKYLCFLDADDLWNKDKIKKQIEFIQKNKYEFSYTSYQFTSFDNKTKGAIVNVPKKINYKGALKNTTIWTSTVMFDMQKLKKEDIYMPNIGSEDTATWWNLLRSKVKYAYGLQEVLSYYRRSSNTLSSNKITAIKRIWNLYRNYEKFSVIKSIYYFCFYAFNAVRRRI